MTAARLITQLGLAAWLALGSGAVAGCAAQSLRAAVSLKLAQPSPELRDASVFIDEQYIGSLGYVAARGVRLPVGEHRITIQKSGYFPWDQLVEADRDAVVLKPALVRIPD